MFEVLMERRLSIQLKNIMYSVTTANSMLAYSCQMDNDQQLLLLDKWDKRQASQCSSLIKTRKPNQVTYFLVLLLSYTVVLTVRVRSTQL